MCRRGLEEDSVWSVFRGRFRLWRRLTMDAVASEDPEVDERQRRVANAIAARSSKLSGMYRTVLGQLAAPALKGGERARVSIICHCVRELMAGLPEAMSDSITPRPNPSSNKLVGGLPRLLASHPEVDLSLDQDVLPVPRPVAQAFHALVTAATQEEGRNRRNAAAMVTGGTNADHPAIRQWQAAYRFNVRWAHLDRDHEGSGPVPSDQEIRAHLRVVEDVVEVRTA